MVNKKVKYKIIAGLYFKIRTKVTKYKAPNII